MKPTPTERRVYTKPSSHVLLPSGEQAWRDRYCIPRDCHHTSQTTWLCIERYLASRAGSTHLESVKFQPKGPRFREFARLLRQPDLHPDDAAPIVDAAYRRLVREVAPSLLRIGIRLG